MSNTSSSTPNVVDVMSCDLIGEMQLDIMSYIDSSCNITNVPPIRCSVFYMKSELYLQVKLIHNEETDMLEGYIEILSRWTESLKFNIKYGMRPYLDYARNQQTFIFTATNRRSQNYPICKLADVVEFMVDNAVSLGHQSIEFICTLTITGRSLQRMIPEYQIATVNARDTDHKLICQGLEIHTHRHILMGASQFFRKRLNAQPLFNVTVIDRLEKSKQLEKDVLVCLLRFMYGLYIHPHNLCTSNLLSAAREFEVNKLFQICEQSLIKQLCPEMAGELFYIGKTEKASELTFEAAKYIIRNYKAVKERYEWDGIMRAFPKFFEPIKPNPLKYFRSIVYPDIRSKSTGDLLHQTGVSFLRRKPEIIPTRPLSYQVKREVKDQTRDESITDSRRESTDTTSASTLMEVDSMVFDSDMQPIRRERSSPVITRRSSESSSPTDPFSMSALQATLPRLKFSRESLKKKLLASESKFEEIFGPATSPLSSSFSERDENKRRLVSAVHKRYRSMENIDFKWNFYQKDFEMDCSEDSELVESEDSSKKLLRVDPAPPSLSPPQLSSGNLGSMRSLVFGQLYSYSSDSVFERKSPKSMSAVSEVIPMSESEVPSTDHGLYRESSKAVKRIDFQTYTHPDARTLSDVSSLPEDTSSFEADSSLSAKPKSRKEKRMKKVAEKTRKFLTRAEVTSSSHQSSELTTKDEPLPESSPKLKIPKVKLTKGKRQPPGKFHKDDIRGRTANSPEKTTTENTPPMPGNIALSQRQPKKVTFDEKPAFLSYAIADEEFDEPELREMKYYESWIDTAAHLTMQGVFAEDSSGQNIISTELYEGNWDEKDVKEKIIPLRDPERVEIKTETTPRGGKKQSSAPIGSSSMLEYKKIKKSSSPINVASSATSKFPISGGVIKKDPERFKKSSVDEPQPRSSSESDRAAFSSSTPSLSSSHSIEDKKFKRTFTDREEMNYESEPETPPRQPSTLVRAQSFVDLGTAYISPIHYKHRRKSPPSLDMYAIAYQDLIFQQRIESNTQRPEDDLKQEVEKVDDVDHAISSEIDVKSPEKTDRDDVKDEDKHGN